MSLATYADLQAAVASRAARQDLTALIPDFIVQAEVRMNRDLARMGGMEAETTITLVGNQDYIALPTDFLYARRAYVASSPLQVLEYKTPERLLSDHPNTDIGVPTAFAVIGTGDGLTTTAMRAVFRKIPDANYVLYLLYGRKVPTLVGGSSGATNWMMTNNPDCYLAAAMIEVALHKKDDAEAIRWETKFQTAMAEAKASDKAVRWTGSRLRQRSSTLLMPGN